MGDGVGAAVAGTGVGAAVAGAGVGAAVAGEGVGAAVAGAGAGTTVTGVGAGPPDASTRMSAQLRNSSNPAPALGSGALGAPGTGA